MRVATQDPQFNAVFALECHDAGLLYPGACQDRPHGIQVVEQRPVVTLANLDVGPDCVETKCLAPAVTLVSRAESYVGEVPADLAHFYCASEKSGLSMWLGLSGPPTRSRVRRSCIAWVRQTRSKGLGFDVQLVRYLARCAIIHVLSIQLRFFVFFS